MQWLCARVPIANSKDDAARAACLGPRKLGCCGRTVTTEGSVAVTSWCRMRASASSTRLFRRKRLRHAATEPRNPAESSATLERRGNALSKLRGIQHALQEKLRQLALSSQHGSRHSLQRSLLAARRASIAAVHTTEHEQRDIGTAIPSRGFIQQILHMISIQTAVIHMI